MCNADANCQGFNLHDGDCDLVSGVTIEAGGTEPAFYYTDVSGSVFHKDNLPTGKFYFYIYYIYNI